MSAFRVPIRASRVEPIRGPIRLSLRRTDSRASAACWVSRRALPLSRKQRRGWRFNF
jgi:hypothetical protein